MRLIRNYLEQQDAEPILFFLKNISDKDEIIQLIKDEIDVRVWFIYSKSKNAEKSTWVKEERAYVQTIGKGSIFPMFLKLMIFRGVKFYEKWG